MTPDKPCRLAFVIPWRDQGRWLWEYLPPEYSGDLLCAAPEPVKGRRRLPPYLGELLTLAHLRPDWNDYDVVFTWELRCALATAFLWKLQRRKRPRWVAVGPILKGPLRRVLPLLRYLLRDADRIVCFARAECDAYAKLLGFPRERFIFLPTPWRSDETISDRDDGFILALGHSGRDYPTLIQAVRGTDLPVRLVAAAPSALAGETPPSNVRVQYQTGHDETNQLIASATLHCIPLLATDYSAGQTVLLRAMAQGKAVIVTDTPAIRDYVTEGETALLVPPGDSAALRSALIRLWNAPETRRQLGENAARSVRESFGFERFAQELTNLADDLIPRP